MWICLNDCFFSIVSKECAVDELMVRARRKGDIEKLWPKAEVSEYTKSDYQFRAKLKRIDIASAIVGEIGRVTYPNFKNSVTDRPLHDAYMSVWNAMAKLQPSPPYSGFRGGLDLGDAPRPARKRGKNAAHS